MLTHDSWRDLSGLNLILNTCSLRGYVLNNLPPNAIQLLEEEEEEEEEEEKLNILFYET